MRSCKAPAPDRRLGVQVILSFAVGYVRQAVQVCLLVETYEFWYRPWWKEGLDVQRCCKMWPTLPKAQRSNSLMVLLKTFIEPFSISNHLLQCRSLSWAHALVTWQKYPLYSFFPHAPFILRTGLSLFYVFWYNSVCYLQLLKRQFMSLINGL